MNCQGDTRESPNDYNVIHKCDPVQQNQSYCHVNFEPLNLITFLNILTQSLS